MRPNSPFLVLHSLQSARAWSHAVAVERVGIELDSNFDRLEMAKSKSTRYSSRSKFDVEARLDMHSTVEQPFLGQVVRMDGASQTTPSARETSKDGGNKCRQ